MPVIRVEATTTTTTMPPVDVRAVLLGKLKEELEHGTERGPAIFEIPLGTDCFDVLVVWQEWAGLRSEFRTQLILDAYGDQQAKIAQALGVTFEEAMQQQLLPYTIVSAFEQNPSFASLACAKDKNKVEELMTEIRDAKLANGGIVLPDDPHGKVELRFPTRAMADNVLSRLRASDSDIKAYWSVVVEVAVTEHLGITG